MDTDRTGAKFFDGGYIEMVESEIRGTPLSVQYDFVARFLLSRYPRPRVLDICCGHGRHLERVLESGLDAVGIDLNRESIEQARARVGDRAELICGDALQLAMPESFDIALNMETSLGSFTREQAPQLLARACESLRLGGRLAVHVFHAENLRRKLEPCAWFRYPSRMIVFERREFTNDGADLAIEQLRFKPVPSAAAPNDLYRLTSHRITLTLFSRDDLVRLLTGAGLEIEGVFGDFHGAAFSAESPDLIVVALKPRVS
jgi:SAM-dependent methyltransferase